jgi:hypothetical protein
VASQTRSTRWTLHYASVAMMVTRRRQRKRRETTSIFVLVDLLALKQWKQYRIARIIRLGPLVTVAWVSATGTGSASKGDHTPSQAGGPLLSFRNTKKRVASPAPWTLPRVPCSPPLPCSPRNNGCCGEREITMRSPPPPPASCAAPVAPAEASARTRASSSSSSAMRSRGASARAQLENQDAFGRKSAGCRYAWRVVPRPSAKSGCRYAPRSPSKSSSGKNWTVPAE